MSERMGDTFVIEPEPEGECDDCGTVAELRPYGRGGSRICFPCAMKDPSEASRQYLARIEGVKKFVINGAPAEEPQ